MTLTDIYGETGKWREAQDTIENYSILLIYIKLFRYFLKLNYE